MSCTLLNSVNSNVSSNDDDDNDRTSASRTSVLVH